MLNLSQFAIYLLKRIVETPWHLIRHNNEDDQRGCSGEDQGDDCRAGPAFPFYAILVFLIAGCIRKNCFSHSARVVLTVLKPINEMVTRLLKESM